MHCRADPMARLERAVQARGTGRPALRQLRTVSGMGDLLALTILGETGEIGRVDRVGNFASYGRCVGRDTRSPGKRTGPGNTQNGHT